MVMAKWYMLTVVGEDRPAIVAKLTHALYEGGCNLGEASMMRLGDCFTVMLMVSSDLGKRELLSLIEPVSDSLGLHVHVDSIKGKLHQHRIPDVRITVSGADRAGIVADVTTALAEAGLNILDLESDVAGTKEQPIYIMHIEGSAAEGIDSLHAVVELVKSKGIDISLSPVDVVIG
jgi:glycine cleavage system transcriptional repressor